MRRERQEKERKRERKGEWRIIYPSFPSLRSHSFYPIIRFYSRLMHRPGRTGSSVLACIANEAWRDGVRWLLGKDWLTGWLTDWLTHREIRTIYCGYWLIDWLIDWSITWSHINQKSSPLSVCLSVVEYTGHALALTRNNSFISLYFALPRRIGSWEPRPVHVKDWIVLIDRAMMIMVMMMMKHETRR